MMRMHYSTNVGSNGSHPTGLDPFDQFGDPTDGDLSDSVFAPDHRTASGTMVTMPHATAAATPAVYATATLTQVLYLQEAGNASLIAVSDINQGQIGDCFLLSSIGELALWHTSAITNMIHANANGTETVTLYLAANGQLPTFGTTSFKATSVTIDNTFPSNAVNSGATQDVLSGQKEIWVQVLEKAVATLEGGYGAISYGGYPVVAMEELTGQPATWMSPASLTLSQLQSFVAAGDLIVMDTPGSGTLPYGLFNDHAYMFGSLTMVSGTAMVQLINPWGFDEPTAIPLASLATGIAEVDVGRFVASTPIIGGPGNDTIILPSAVTNASIDLGAGNDTLAFANGTNSATVANTETIIGGTGNDTITLATAAANASVDLGAGSDKLTLANATNSATVANVETLVGGTGNDTITLGSVLTAAMSVDLGAGSNKLTLAAGGATGVVSNVNTLIGGAGNDAVTLGTAAANASIDLGAGSKRRNPRWRHRQ
ncbi:MAG: C2 family cysteine protease [Acetobacteraceae bacterium]